MYLIRGLRMGVAVALVMGLISVMGVEVYAFVLYGQSNGTSAGIGAVTAGGDVDDEYVSTNPLPSPPAPPGNNQEKVEFTVEACCDDCPSSCDGDVCGITVTVDFVLVDSSNVAGPPQSDDNSDEIEENGCQQCVRVPVSHVADPAAYPAGFSFPARQIDYTITTECYCCETEELYGTAVVTNHFLTPRD